MAKRNIAKDCSVYKDDMLSSLLLSTMSKQLDKSKWDIQKAFPLLEKTVEGELEVGLWGEVKLSIAGVELDLDNFAKTLKEQFDSMVEQRAVELIEERCDNMMHRLRQVQKEVDLVCEENFPKANRYK